MRGWKFQGGRWRLTSIGVGSEVDAGDQTKLELRFVRVPHSAASNRVTLKTPDIVCDLPPMIRPAVHRFSTRTVLQNLAALLGVSVVVGCQSPLENDPDHLAGDELAAAARSSIELQVAQVPAGSAPIIGASEGEIETMLASRREELDAIGPKMSDLGPSLDVGIPLGGSDASAAQVVLSLQSAIQAAVANNLSVQNAQLQKAVTDAQIVQAEAAFDWVLGAATGYQRIERPSIGILFPGFSDPVIPSVTNQNVLQLSTNLQKQLTAGGSFSVGVTENFVDNLDTEYYTPDPAYQTALTLGFTQPLLRGFGTEVNLAQIRVAQNQDLAAFQALRAQLLKVVSDTEATYWALVQARNQLVTAQWLVEVGTEVREVLAKRRQFDATVSEYANAVATVEQRKATVLDAKRATQIAANALKALMNSTELPVGGDTLIVPSDFPSATPFQADLRSSLTTALECSPAVESALIGIDTADIGVVVSDNGLLPQLNLATQVEWFGLAGGFGSSVGQVADGDFVDYAAGLQFSQAIGNRAAESAYRQARLQRSQAVIQYRTAVQSAALAVKNALIDCVSYRELVEQNRQTRLAQAENLRALLVDERTLAALSPEFLQLKFQTQNALAQSQNIYIGALAAYQVSIARLHQAMGDGLEVNRIEVLELSEDSTHTTSSRLRNSNAPEQP
ncbi:MAG: TolC family protein [Planctomycetota bacterium]|nr:MAG: TolC family protein [Planctomycetota bacterium]